MQSNPTKETLTELLTKYVELGWVIVPCDNKKKPLKNWREFNSIGDIIKPNVEDLLKDVNTTFRGLVSGIGVITGKHSNLIVIDLDTYKDSSNFDDIKEKLLELDTPIAQTGGGGYHIYFTYNESIKTKANLTKGLDTRGQGGFVVLPPSKHQSGNYYQWIKSPFDFPPIDLPDTLLTILPNERDTSVQLTPQKFQTFNYNKIYQPGERDGAMFSMARSLIQMLPKHRLADAGYSLFASWCKDHIEDSSGEMTSESFLREKFAHALTYDDLNKSLPSNVTDLFNDPNVFENLFKQDRFGIPIGFEKIDKKTGGILGSSLTILAAQTGIGKTIVFLNFLENISKLRKVAYLDLENGVNETLERLIRIKHKMSKEYFVNPDNQEEIMKLTSSGFENFSYVSSNEKIRDRKKLDYKLNELVDKGVEVFVIDPLQIIDGGQDLVVSGEIVKDLSDFSKRFNVAVMLCHHFKKPQGAGGKFIKSVDDVAEHQFLDPTMEDIKGGAIITDTAENVWAITRNVLSDDPLVKSRIILKIMKCRNNAEAQGLYALFFDHQTLRVYERQEQLSFYFNNTMYSNFMKG
jgi:archaellum biogenesis ATPase FlaH